MTRRIRSSLCAALLVAGALSLAACSSPAAPEPAASTPASAPDASTPTPVATSEPTPGTIGKPTCESILPDDVIADFAKAKWTAKEDVFRVGSLTFPEGIQCVWGDYSVASDHVQVFGWAPVSDTEAQTARSELLASGWTSVDDEYITENKANVLNPDADGYGMTYQFGDGWMTLADTKQGLLLIERPGS
ncbi:hypothetical protein [Microbacterium sp. SORGH_AS_0862]|uniref:hypothetical protein n=1 Tax=Microbacterium sp. SORGH_AS_0862 TaxID=3041789 RepID=UPI002794513B|nr:hypothetical protein [Microbacterium sp. SORGH_AS_0862]MDQ1206657.1 hypothetical protein [Microbacterium sp. SORGH_AS_0862]